MPPLSLSSFSHFLGLFLCELRLHTLHKFDPIFLLPQGSIEFNIVQLKNYENCFSKNNFHGKIANLVVTKKSIKLGF